MYSSSPSPLLDVYISIIPPSQTLFLWCRPYYKSNLIHYLSADSFSGCPWTFSELYRKLEALPGALRVLSKRQFLCSEWLVHFVFVVLWVIIIYLWYLYLIFIWLLFTFRFKLNHAFNFISCLSRWGLLMPSVQN